MNRWFPVETERLLLREFRPEDEHDIHAYASDPEVVRLMIWGPNTPEMTKTYLAGALKEQDEWPRASVSLAIELKSERRVIGSIGLRIKDEKIAPPTSATSSLAPTGATATWPRPLGPFLMPLFAGRDCIASGRRATRAIARRIA